MKKLALVMILSILLTGCFVADNNEVEQLYTTSDVAPVFIFQGEVHSDLPLFTFEIFEVGYIEGEIGSTIYNIKISNPKFAEFVPQTIETVVVGSWDRTWYPDEFEEGVIALTDINFDEFADLRLNVGLRTARNTSFGFYRWNNDGKQFEYFFGFMGGGYEAIPEKRQVVVIIGINAFSHYEETYQLMDDGYFELISREFVDRSENLP